MRAGLHLLALVGTAALALAAPGTKPSTTTSATKSTQTCTSVTRTVNFEDLPTGTISPSLNYHGLNYEGWEVVDTKDTVFTKEKSTHILRLVGNNGIIKTANPKEFYLDPGGPGSPSFYFGCQNKTAVIDCSFAKDYNVPGDTPEQNQQYNTYDGFFNAADYPHSLEAAGTGETISVHNVSWGVATGEGGTPSKKSDLHLYIANYRYNLGNCEGAVTVG